MNQEKNNLKKINDFYDEKFEHPLKWKIITAVLVFGLVMTAYSRLAEKPAGTSNDPAQTETDTDRIDYAQLNKYIEDTSKNTGISSPKLTPIPFVSITTSLGLNRSIISFKSRTCIGNGFVSGVLPSTNKFTNVETNLSSCTLTLKTQTGDWSCNLPTSTLIM